MVDELSGHRPGLVISRTSKSFRLFSQAQKRRYSDPSQCIPIAKRVKRSSSPSKCFLDLHSHFEVDLLKPGSSAPTLLRRVLKMGDTMTKYAFNFLAAICAGAAMVGIAGCAPTTHVTETTTTRQYDTTDPAALTPVASSGTTTTTRYNNGTVQQTSSEPVSYASPQETTTTVTSDPDGSTMQKQTTTTTYATP